MVRGGSRAIEAPALLPTPYMQMLLLLLLPLMLLLLTPLLLMVKQLLLLTTLLLLPPERVQRWLGTSVKPHRH